MASSDVHFLEELTLNSSGAIKQMFYDGWVLRFSPGSNTKRANSVTPLYSSTYAIETKLTYCEDIYAREGIPLRFRISEYCKPPHLDAYLAEQSYEKVDSTLFMLRDSEKCGDDTLMSLDVRQLPLTDWLEINHHLRGNTKETIEAHRARLESVPLTYYPIVSFIDDKPASLGLGIRQGNYFGIFDIFTTKKERRKGYGKQITQRLLQIARREQVQFSFLQVEENNTSAKQIYAGLGFKPIYQYWYRVKTP